MENGLNPGRRPSIEAVAHAGQGVMEALDYLSSEVLTRFQ